MGSRSNYWLAVTLGARQYDALCVCVRSYLSVAFWSQRGGNMREGCFQEYSLSILRSRRALSMHARTRVSSWKSCAANNIWGLLLCKTHTTRLCCRGSQSGKRAGQQDHGPARLPCAPPALRSSLCRYVQSDVSVITDVPLVFLSLLFLLSFYASVIVRVEIIAAIIYCHCCSVGCGRVSFADLRGTSFDCRPPPEDLPHRWEVMM